eukprot:189606-Prymnesium_polylepis.1
MVGARTGSGPQPSPSASIVLDPLAQERQGFRAPATWRGCSAALQTVGAPTCPGLHVWPMVRHRWAGGLLSPPYTTLAR